MGMKTTHATENKLALHTSPRRRNDAGESLLQAFQAGVIL